MAPGDFVPCAEQMACLRDVLRIKNVYQALQVESVWLNRQVDRKDEKEKRKNNRAGRRTKE
jgi:hypothetical protein